MLICKKIFIKCIEDFITINRNHVSIRIFNSLYLLLLVLSLSSGTYSLIFGKDFTSWGWIVFTIGCLLLMIIFMMVIVYFMTDLIYTTEKKLNYNINPVVMIKQNINGAKKSKRIDLVIKN